MIENNFVASLRSDGAFGVALVFKPEGQYCMCSLSHGVAPHGASPLNHRRTGTLICPVCAKDALVAYWHLTNMFSSHGARHTPHPHVRTQLFSKFHSHLSALVLRACGSATWSVRTSSTKSLHVHSQRDIFPPIFRIVTLQHYSLGYRAVSCWQGVHFFMFVSVEPASSMHTHKSDSQLRAHHRKSCGTHDE